MMSALTDVDRPLTADDGTPIGSVFGSIIMKDIGVFHVYIAATRAYSKLVPVTTRVATLVIDEAAGHDRGWVDAEFERLLELETTKVVSGYYYLNNKEKGEKDG